MSFGDSIRGLLDDGIPWAFLTAAIVVLLLTPLAYLIARTVCVRKQGSHGSAPMWVYILLSTIPAVVAVALFLGADAISLIMHAATR